jgi:DNA-binding NarL/FixJ family response regulator
MSLGQANHDPIRIVIADDDRLFASMVRTKLSARAEFDVVGIARNGREAVALAEHFEPDLVLMDVAMPLLDGVEASRVIREAPNAPTVVLVTGDDEDLDTRAYGAGAAAYLRKSEDLVGLIDLILAVSIAAPLA